MSDFPPIADYGFLSDCEDNCLVALDGSVEWLCLPRPDSPSVFGALLDRSAGTFRFGPANTAVIDRLIEAGTLLARGRLEHSYPHSWRSKAPVIFRNTPQWFIRLDEPLADDAHAGRTLREMGRA